MEWIGVVRSPVKEPTDEGWGKVVAEVVLDAVFLTETSAGEPEAAECEDR